MRAVPALLFLLLVVPLLAMPAAGAPPQSMAFNKQPAADVRGPVLSIAVDGPGLWAGAAVGDSGPGLPDDADLVMFTPNGLKWVGRDNDLLNEGGRLVAMANGTQGQAGAWLVLVNNSAAEPRIAAYQTSGFGQGSVEGQAVWLHNPGFFVQGLDLTGDGNLIGLAGGLASANATYLLLQNRGFTGAPQVLYKGVVSPSEYQEVVRFTSVALSTNSSIPAVPSANRAVYAVVGAERVSTQGNGAIFVVETVFSPTLQNPTSRIVLRIDTSGRVTDVDITADGEYAVAGTDNGQLYLISVGEALVRKGVQGINPPLRAWQQNLGSSVSAIAIARQSGDLFAAGTEDGDVVVFRNEQNPAGSEGAQGREVARSNSNNPSCRPSLSGRIASLAMTDRGEQVVAGAMTGLMSFEASAHARYAPGPFEPAWCVAMDAGDQGTQGVQVDVSADGKHVYAGGGHRVFGYRNFYALSVTPDQDRKTVSPGERVQWSLRVRNDGSVFDRVALLASGPQDPGWKFELSNTSLHLMPGKEQVVLLNVTTPPTIAPGNFSIQVQSTPDRAGSQAQTTTTLRLDLGQLRRVELRPPQGILTASEGSPTSVPITVHNGGNNHDRFRVTARIPDPEENFKSRGSDWVIRAEDASDRDTVLDIGPNSDGTMNLVVTPQRARRGDYVTVEITVEGEVPSPDGTVPVDVKQVTVAIEPSYNGDIALAETKELRVEQGGSIFINYTVKNLGNTADIFQVENRTQPANAAGWLLQLSDKRFELRGQGSQKTVRLTVNAQQGLQPGETVTILVNLASEGLVKQNPGSDGQVDSQSVTVTVIAKRQRGLPMAPEPLILLAVLGAALLARRRWDA